MYLANLSWKPEEEGGPEGGGAGGMGAGGGGGRRDGGRRRGEARGGKLVKGDHKFQNWGPASGGRGKLVQSDHMIYPLEVQGPLTLFMVKVISLLPKTAPW